MRTLSPRDTTIHANSIPAQAAGAAPLVVGHSIDNPETIATAIRIGNPVSRDLALAARDESGGAIDSVTDEEILAAYKLLAATEGIVAWQVERFGEQLAERIARFRPTPENERGKRRRR